MRLVAWESRTEWPVTFMSILFMGVYAAQILIQPAGAWNSLAEWSMNIMWALFGADYITSLVLADDTWHWFIHHLFDLAVVILPMIRPLRVLRVMTALNALHKTSGMALRGRITAYVSAAMVLLIFIGSLAVLDAERHAPGATITTFGRALWWTFVTITTVGYGDLTPVTATGKIIAVALMLAGIALIGVVTATLASWIVDAVSAEEKMNTEITREQVEEVSKHLAHIEKLLSAKESACDRRGA